MEIISLLTWAAWWPHPANCPSSFSCKVGAAKIVWTIMHIISVIMSRKKVIFDILIVFYTRKYTINIKTNVNLIKRRFWIQVCQINLRFWNIKFEYLYFLWNTYCFCRLDLSTYVQFRYLLQYILPVKQYQRKQITNTHIAIYK